MTHYQQLFEIAADNYGIVTSAQAKREGISDKEMSAIASRGRIRRLGRGVYKIVDYIPVENDPYAEAVALVGPEAFLFGESVLAMLHLAPTNPTRITVATPRRVRKQLPGHIRVEPAPADVEPTEYEGIPSEPVAEAICTCHGRLMPTRLEDATREARRQGYVTETEERKLLVELAGAHEGETA